MRAGVVPPPVVVAAARRRARAAGVQRLSAAVLAVPAHGRVHLRVLILVQTIAVVTELAGGVPLGIAFAVRRGCGRHHQRGVEVIEPVRDGAAADATVLLTVVVQAAQVPLKQIPPPPGSVRSRPI